MNEGSLQLVSTTWQLELMIIIQWVD